MRSSADLREVDRFPILAHSACLSVALVISEAVFDANDDPVMANVLVCCL